MPKQTEPRMEMRALLAIVLSMLVLTLYQYLFAPVPEVTPSPEPGAAASAPSPESRAAPAEAPAESAVRGTQKPGVAPEPVSVERVMADAEMPVRLETPLFSAELTNRGGRLVHYRLTRYQDGSGHALDLVHPGARAQGRLPFGLVGGNGDRALLDDELWQVAVEGGRRRGDTYELGAGDVARVRFRFSDGESWVADKVFEFRGDSYQLGLEASVRAPEPVFLALGPGMDPGNNGSRRTFLTRGAVVLRDGSLEKWAAKKLEGPVTLTGAFQWAGIESDYFLEAFLLAGQPAEVAVAVVPLAPEAAGSSAAEPPVQLAMRLPQEGVAVPVYLGPKKYDALVKEGHELQRVVDFGFWGFLSRPLLLLLNWIQGFVGNYGVAIIVLTILLRAVFWPLNHKAMVSMRKTQALQPKMAAIRAKYQGVKDIEKRQKMQEEIMQLYRREGVSPFGGCLPMLAQFPILLAFYAMLSVAIELRAAPFMLWVKDLSQHDPYLVLPLLMGASMIVQQRMTPTAGANPTQARMMRFMPVMFTVLFLWVPSGLVLYWLSNNLLGIAQQVYINRQLDRDAQADPRAKGKKPGQRGKR